MILHYTRSSTKGMFTLLFVASLVPADAQTVQWMRQGGLAGEGRGIAHDAAGSVYVVGTVGDPVLFDTYTSAAHFADAFIAKYSGSGALQWVHTGGAGLIDQANDVVTDADGNSYVTGFFSTNGPNPTVDFDGTVLQGLGSLDLFVAKYASDGTLLWIRSGGGALADEGRGIAMTADGNIVVSGTFQGTAVFGNDTLVSAGMGDILLLKYDTAGDLLWSARAGGTGDDAAGKVAALSNGDVAFVADHQGTVNIGSSTVTATGLGNVLLARYTGNGAPVWATGAGSTVGFARDRAFDIDVAGNDDLVFCGEVAGAAVFAGTPLPTNGSSDLFIARYTGSGDLLWVHHAGGPQVDHAYGVAVDAAGNSYLTGQADDGANTVFDTITLAPFGNEAVFLAKYDAAGAVQYVKRYAPGLGRALTLLDEGCLFFTGAASGIVGQPAFDAVPWQYTDRAIFTALFCEDLTAGIGDDVAATGVFHVFPNPATDQVRLMGIPNNAQITVFDDHGRIVQRTNNTTTLDIAALVPSMYTVRAVHASGVATYARMVIAR